MKLLSHRTWQAIGPRALVVAASLAAAFALAPSVARAATPEEIVAGIIELNKKAIGSYRAGKHTAAMTDLQTAAKLAEDNDLSDHDMAARTYIHMGIVAIVGQKDRGNGLEYLARALMVRPKIKLTPTLATPALKKDLRLAEKKVVPILVKAAKKAPPAAPKDDGNQPKDKEPAEEIAKAEPEPAPAPRTKESANEPPLPQKVPQPLYCPTPDLGPPHEAVPLFCLTQPSLPASKVVAYFRQAGGADYTAVPMNRKKSGWLHATVPAKAVTGRSLQVYFEAQDSGGNVAANNGKDELPNVILLKQGAPHISPKKLALIEVGDPPPSRDAGPEATPLELRAIAEEKAAADALTPKGRPRRAASSVWVGLGFGSGYGWHLDLPLERHRGRQVTTGFSPAGLGHVAPELGYQLTSRFSVSLQSRHQYLPADGSGDAEATGAPPQLAHALLVRIQYAMFDLGDLQFLASLAAGGGSALRMQIAPNKRSGVAASDTVVAGPFAGGPGLGLAYNFTPSIIAALEGRALAGAPAFAVMIEGTAGLQIGF